MPYLPSTRKEQLDADPKIANTPGDFNYLFTVCYLKEWLKDGNQRYHTIDRIKAASELPLSPLTENLERLIQSHCPVTGYAISTAKKAAYDEFRRRVVDPYEEFCIVKNGDIKEYEQAEQLLINRMGRD